MHKVHYIIAAHVPSKAATMDNCVGFSPYLTAWVFPAIISLRFSTHILNKKLPSLPLDLKPDLINVLGRVRNGDFGYSYG